MVFPSPISSANIPPLIFPIKSNLGNMSVNWPDILLEYMYISLFSFWFLLFHRKSLYLNTSKSYVVSMGILNSSHKGLMSSSSSSPSYVLIVSRSIIHASPCCWYLSKVIYDSFSETLQSLTRCLKLSI